MRADTKTSLYLTSAVLGGAASVVLALANLFDWTGWLYGGPALVTIVSLLAILNFFVPFAAGFIDGFAGTEATRDFPYELAAIGAFVAFYAGFLLTWLRSVR